MSFLGYIALVSAVLTLAFYDEYYDVGNASVCRLYACPSGDMLLVLINAISTTGAFGGALFLVIKLWFWFDDIDVMPMLEVGVETLGAANSLEPPPPPTEEGNGTDNSHATSSGAIPRRTMENPNYEMARFADFDAMPELDGSLEPHPSSVEEDHGTDNSRATSVTSSAGGPHPVWSPRRTRSGAVY